MKDGGIASLSIQWAARLKSHNPMMTMTMHVTMFSLILTIANSVSSVKRMLKMRWWQHSPECWAPKSDIPPGWFEQPLGSPVTPQTARTVGGCGDRKTGKTQLITSFSMWVWVYLWWSLPQIHQVISCKRVRCKKLFCNTSSAEPFQVHLTIQRKIILFTNQRQ